MGFDAIYFVYDLTKKEYIKTYLRKAKAIERAKKEFGRYNVYKFWFREEGEQIYPDIVDDDDHAIT